ncbi:MAG: MBOAT family O-acyltransferase [Phycisphaerales bacterium]|nr:MBOAT family O-acyltransferase [Phycisphaerales bacterium]
MIFSSPEFIFAFVPVVFLVAFLVRKLVSNTAVILVWLTLSSLFFYGFWKADYLPIIVVSILANWLIGKWILATRDRGKVPLFIGIVLNLLAIGYYKYFDFFISNVNSLTGGETSELGLLLPLGISFFTFQQIAYLVDTYKGEVGRTGILEYAFFVSFFPQLIAGPIVHHRHILPSVRKGDAFGFKSEEILKGLHAFSIGFVKKVVFADIFAVAASAVFDAADAGQSINTHDALLGAVSYTFQIYFDFSGYTDMAIGLGYMFGVKLPKNFDSPYKSFGIIEFWRRWHITLSEFLRDYLYVPLGGNRRGLPRRYFNLLSTMFLGGLWHGASWTFVVWGVAHGLLLMLNHSIRKFIPRPHGHLSLSIFRLGSWVLTFAAVILTWVAFRSTTWSGMWEMYQSIFMIGDQVAQVDGFLFDPRHMSYPIPYHYLIPDSLTFWPWVVVVIGLVICVAMPNTWQLMQAYEKKRGGYRLGANLATVIYFAFGSYFILYLQNRITEFIYFNF